MMEGTVAEWLSDPVVHDLVSFGLLAFVAILIGCGIYGGVRPGASSGERAARLDDRNGPDGEGGTDPAEKS